MADLSKDSKPEISITRKLSLLMFKVKAYFRSAQALKFPLKDRDGGSEAALLK